MIVIDLTLATRSANLTGVERYGINLFEAWSAQDDEVMALVCPGTRFTSPRIGIIEQPPIKAWLQAPFFLPKETRAVLFPSFPPSPFFLGKSIPSYRIIHDTVPFEHGQTMPLRGRLVFRNLEKIFLRKYSGIFCPTATVATRFRQLFPLVTAAVCGNAPGLDIDASDRQPISAVLPGDLFILAVGTLEPRKNYLRLIELFRQWAPPGFKLLIAGRAGWGNIDGHLRGVAAQSGDLIWLPNVTDSELRWLYAQCAAFVSFSTAEGFNMPLVEAGCLGRPILASDIEIHRAVAAPWAKFLDLAASPEAFAAAISEVLRLPAPPGAAATYRERYSWPHIASLIKDAMRAA